MEKKSIDIDIEIYRYLEHHRISFDEDYSHILKRLLSINSVSQEVSKGDIKSSGLYWKGILFKDGLKLRGFYKGSLLEAVVKNGKIKNNNKEYTSPSAAAFGATGMNMNGWTFWEYFDEKKNKWISISKLKK